MAAETPDPRGEDLDPTLDSSAPPRDCGGTDETIQASHPAAWPFDSDDAPPEVIGPYRIIGVIGSGGMGAVYEAAQENPKRRVALKVVRSGRASPAAMKRFQFEVEALARLRHPGIAQIYEAGTFGRGEHEQPYFAMEYIPGARPITLYADDQNLDVGARLRLFCRVCQAVHHGHQKGIIHRDLKPDNILIDRDGNPKIIDFGVARATNADLAVTTMQTSVGQIIGTLQYMSPEQCLGDPNLVDTRADVYSLGVILYELLCHELPYDVQRQAMLEAIRIIREDSPKRPSTVTRVIRGDLETITLKALEKQSDRRYDSAMSFASDIGHYLDHDPIAARPPNFAYQARMFAYKHRLAAVAAAVVVLSVTGGLIATSLAWRHASELAGRLEIAHGEVTVQRDLAQTRLQQAKDLHRSQLRDTFHAVRDLEGALDEKLRMATSVAAYFEGLRNAGQADRADLEALADAYFELAEIRGGAAHGNIGRLDEALEDIARARVLWQELADSAGDDVRPRIKVAIMRRREALIRQELRQFSEAVAALEAAQLILHDVPVGHPNALAAARVRGLALLDQGDIRWALEDPGLARESWQRGMNLLQQTAERHPGNPRVRRDHAHGYRRVGLVEAERDADAGHRTLQQSRRIFEALHKEYPANDVTYRDLGMAWYYEGWAAMLIPLRTESLDALDNGWQIIILRCVATPGDALARSDVAEYLGSMREIHGELGAHADTREAARKAAVALQPVVEAHPDNLALAETLQTLIDASRSHASAAPSGE